MQILQRCLESIFRELDRRRPSLESGMVFQGTTGVYEPSALVWTYLSFQFQMSKKEREIYDFEMDFKKYILLLFISEYSLPRRRFQGRSYFFPPHKGGKKQANLSNDDVISQRPGLKTGVKNDIFWSEIDLSHTAAILSNFVYAGLASFSLRGQPYINKVFLNLLRQNGAA